MKLLLFFCSLSLLINPLGSQELYKIKDGSKEGFINSSGKLIGETWNAIIMILAPHARDPMNDIPIATFKVGRDFNIV